MDHHAGADARVRRVPTARLTAGEKLRIRALLARAFLPDDFGDDDWDHALGGIHFVLERDGQIVSHASVVERELRADAIPVRTGYVEAVATDPAVQGQGVGSRVMDDVAGYIRERFELGALGTGAFHFYERLGWIRWRGPTFVRTLDGPVRTPDEDGNILILLTPSSPPLDVTAPLSCEWRPGDVW